MRSKGFTLVELMVVIAIIAILAAIALTSYKAYQRKAQSKELMTIARSCAQELVAACLSGTDNPQASNYETCQENQESPYGEVSVTAQATCSGGNISSISVTAEGTSGNIDGYKSTCTYNTSTDSVTCTQPSKG